jgi:hypothetical protein
MYKTSEESHEQCTLRSRILGVMPRRFMHVMNDKLFSPILLEELHRNAKAMAKGKSPRPNGVAIK